MNTNDLIYHNQRRSSTEFHRSPERSEGSLVVKIIVATKDETAMNLRRDSVPYPASHRIIVLRSVENEHETQHSPPIYSYHFVSFKYRNGPGFSHTHRFELGPEVTQIYPPVNPVGSVQYQPAVGGSAAFNLSKYFGIDSSISITPTVPISATTFAGGRLTQFFAGGRAGIRKGRFRIYGKLRPGLVSFGSAITAVGPAPDFQLFEGRLTAFAFHLRWRTLP